jgi:hypothetical protein
MSWIYNELYVPHYARRKVYYPNFPNCLWQQYACNTPAYYQYQNPLCPYNPLQGKYGTCDTTLKGYGKTDNCQWGYYPANINGQCACCNTFGECGFDNKRIM